MPPITGASQSVVKMSVSDFKFIGGKRASLFAMA